jgi:hypothetical protein
LDIFDEAGKPVEGRTQARIKRNYAADSAAEDLEYVVARRVERGKIKIRYVGDAANEVVPIHLKIRLGLAQ